MYCSQFEEKFKKELIMPNTPDREVARKHRIRKKKWTARNQASLANAKKKTLEELHEMGRLPKSLFHRLGL
jgi:hypothetical protein